MKGANAMCICGKNALVSELGYWPEFCDAKIDELTFRPYSDSGSELQIVLHYIDLDKNRDLIVQINLIGVLEMSFTDFCVENVIDKINLEGSSEDGFYFEIEACVGIFGNCKSRSAEIEIISSKQLNV